MNWGIELWVNDWIFSFLSIDYSDITCSRLFSNETSINTVILKDDGTDDQWSHSEFTKIPRSCYEKIPRLNKNSQAILKTRENGENENNFTFTNIEKNILLRLHGVMCQSY